MYLVITSMGHCLFLLLFLFLRLSNIFFVTREYELIPQKIHYIMQLRFGNENSIQHHSQLLI